jgi:serine/threonine protein kinase
MYYANLAMKNARIMKVSDEPVKSECALMRKVGKIVPHCVPKVYGCRGAVMHSEYIYGGSLKQWISANQDRLTDEYMGLLIGQVVSMLSTIYASDRSFRHHDLHLENILVDDRSNAANARNATGIRLMLADFGLARDTGIKNPEYEGLNANSTYAHALRDDYGIYAGSHYMYDTIFFLASLYSHTVRYPPGTVRFLARIKKLFKGLLLQTKRLKPDAKPTFTFRDILSDSFITEPQIVSFARGQTLANLAKHTRGFYRSMLPSNLKNSPNRNRYLKSILKFVPRRTPPKKRSPPRSWLAAPAALKNAAPKFIPRPPKPVRKPLAPRIVPKLVAYVHSPKRKSPVKRSPIMHFLNRDATTFRPKNVENVYRAEGRTDTSAKRAIERIVAHKEDAWEKARKALSGTSVIIRRGT